MARLSYLNDPEHMRDFAAADIVDGRDETGRHWSVYGPDLRKIDAEGTITRVRQPPFVVPIVRERGELRMLLEDCRDIRGSCNYELLAEEIRREAAEQGGAQ